MKQMSKPLLSVVIPLYNAEKYVEKCILSVVNQTYQNIEVMVVDDGASDKSGEIADKLANEYKNIIVIHQDNRGVSAARNVGLQKMSGEYVTFIDADDYVDIDTYAIIMEEFSQNRSDAVIYPFSRDYQGKSDIYNLPWPNKTLLAQEEIHTILIPVMIAGKEKEKTISGSVCRTVFKSSVLDEIFFDEDVYIQEDLLFCIKAYAKMHKIEVLNEVTYHYVKHGITTTEHYRPQFLIESIAFEEKIVNTLRENDLYESVEDRYWGKRLRMYSLCLSNLFRYDAPLNYGAEIDEIITSFQQDKYIGNKICNAYLKKGMIVPYILLKCGNRYLISLIYGVKERHRHKKLSD